MNAVEGLLGDRFDVGNVGGGRAAALLKEEAVGLDGAVADGKWGDSQVAVVDGAVELDGLGFDVASVGVFFRKCPAEHGAEDVERFGAAVHGEWGFTTPAEGAEFIEPGDVIDVAVGVENGIEAGEFFAQRLLTEVRSGIDEEIDLAGADVDGGASAGVARVGGGADGAIAADDGHADGGAGAEESDFEVCGHLGARMATLLETPSPLRQGFEGRGRRGRRIYWRERGDGHGDWWRVVFGHGKGGFMRKFGEGASESTLSSAIAQLEGVARATPDEPFELRQEAAVRQKDALIQWAGDRGLILDPNEFPERPVLGGAEHEVFPYDGEFWKITHTDSFGWVPSAGDNGFPDVVCATPLDYLIRWNLVNRVLGDRVLFRGITYVDEGLSLVISQPAIEGVNADSDQIRARFEQAGFRSLSRFTMGAEADSSYYEPDRRLGVFDASGDNVLNSGGIIVPIDVVVVEASEALHRQFLDLIRSRRG